MLKLTTTITYTLPPEALKKHLRPIATEGLRDLGEHWHEHYLPLHFAESAYARYGGVYTPRDSRYCARKGHHRPMYWRGRLYEAATGTGRIEATGKGVRVKMSNLSAVNLHNGRRSRFNFREELTATSADELRTFARRLDRAVHRGFEMAREPTTKTFG